MEAVWLPHPLPSLVVVAPDGAAAGLRGMRQRMADAMRDDPPLLALAAVDEYEAALAACSAPPAGVTWHTPNGAVCSFESGAEAAMLVQARAALCVRAAAAAADRETRCLFLAEALAAVRNGPGAKASSGREAVLCALLHAEYVALAPPPNAGAWRAVYVLALSGAHGLTAAGDAAGAAAAQALASETLACACEAEAEERYAAARFAEAAELGAAGRPTFGDRAEQLAAIAAQRNLLVRRRSAVEMIDMLPPVAVLPQL